MLLCLTLDNKSLFSNTSFFDLVNLLEALFLKLILFYAYFFPITCLLFLQLTAAQTFEYKIVGAKLIFQLLYFLLSFSWPKAPTPITKGPSVSFRRGVKAFIHRHQLLYWMTDINHISSLGSIATKYRKIAVGLEKIMFSRWDSHPCMVQFSSMNLPWHMGPLWKMFIWTLGNICDMLVV